MVDRIYNTARWRRLRAAHLRLFPLCCGCERLGIVRAANTVDHIVPISAGGPAFPDHDGLASYCPACHSAKTVRGTEAGAVKTSRPRKGCDANGNPLDPAHPWHLSTKSIKSLRAGANKTVTRPKNSISSRFQASVIDGVD